MGTDAWPSPSFPYIWELVSKQPVGLRPSGRAKRRGPQAQIKELWARTAAHPGPSHRQLLPVHDLGLSRPMSCGSGRLSPGLWGPVGLGLVGCV